MVKEKIHSFRIKNAQAIQAGGNDFYTQTHKSQQHNKATNYKKKKKNI